MNENKTQNQNTENPNINTDGDASAGVAIPSLAEMALQEARKDVEDTGQASLVGYLNDFFVKNCYGYKGNKAGKSLNMIANQICELSDENNPPVEIAAVLCSEFKKMCEGGREEYWKGLPLIPANMIKGRVMAELIQNAGKILATSNNSSKFMQAARKAQEECEAEKDIVYDAIRQEYLKYNIDPDDPNASKLLIQAKSKEQAEKKAEDENFEIF